MTEEWAAASHWLVDVALPVPLRMHFTYRLPEHWEPRALRAGQRVLAPFRAKLLHGVTLVDPYRGEATAKTRALVSFDGAREVLSAEVRQLLAWLVKYYRAPIGEAVRLALPPGVLSEDEIEYQLSEAGLTFVDQQPSERRLGLLRGRSLSKVAWEALCQTQIPLAQIRSWEDEGLLLVGKTKRERESVPYVNAVLLTEAGREADPAALMRAPRQRELLDFVRQRNGAPILWQAILDGMPQLSSALAPLVKRGFLEKRRMPKYELETRLEGLELGEIKELTDEQAVALAAIERSLEAGRFHSALLFGVTGAGKTEVYLRAIQSCLAKGRQALFLVPEIALTPIMQRRIEDRFGERLAILHSAVGAGKRNDAWARVLAGKVDLVLGARSSLFAPLPRLGLVIVDEEHDGSYKQNDGVRYHARDLALVRAKMADATVILGSATPSLESWHNHLLGRHELLTIGKRATQALMPTVTVVDMREEFKQQRKRPIFSRLLLERMRETLERGHQIMILLNRRGYHSFLMCRKCGVVCMCSQCEVSLTYHRSGNLLKCHYCDETREVPQSCAACGAEQAMMQFFGEGTQQIEEMLQAQFAVPIGRLDRDQMTSKHAHSEILERFERGETRILVGTQMIAKGHDFPKVTLVGILNADQGLRLPDFRSAETVFQLLTQVSGRSGRGQDHGSVVVQSYMPEHYAIECATRHDYLGFLEKELRYRKHLYYSPFSFMVNILITYKDEAKASETAEWLARRFRPLCKQMDLVVLGPTRAPVARIKNQYRYQILLKSGQRLALHQLADQAICEAVAQKMLPATAITLDIDPYFFG